MFLRRKKVFISDHALLLTITPQEIAGVKLDSERFSGTYTPLRFIELPLKDIVSWPPPLDDETEQREENEGGGAMSGTPRDSSGGACNVVVEEIPEQNSQESDILLAPSGEGNGDHHTSSTETGQGEPWKVTIRDTQSKILFRLFTYIKSDLLKHTSTALGQSSSAER
ncbi:hypothetical protein GBAR_LOCUS18034 [Geodia barretti]|uniref:Uncharacterized protein n=1 Tax=Geodia barretti TaxID=519541 RepID=A0AA35SMG2_GEOBA|nr:hypothetical protein GBAR_LOCUS18034 [Geodia barretti]